MAENSHIEWTDHTFNPWMGCTKVSPGCKHCYAETLMDARYKKVKWGPQGTRVRTSEAMWKKPLQWNKQKWAECVCGWRGVFNEHGKCPDCAHPMVATMKPARQRVFCASLADVFEDNNDVGLWRHDLFDLIHRTPNLDWLILTKRPEMIRTFIPGPWIVDWPANVWIGTSIENQETADKRLPYLVSLPARVRFISVEPLLSSVKLQHEYDGEYVRNWLHPNGVNWVICGGESGPEARPMHPKWARSLRDQCVKANVSFFFKQWGEWEPIADLYADDGPDKAFEYMEYWLAQIEPNGAIPVLSAPIRKKGGWHEYQPCPGSWFMAKVGKKAAGRLLDGREWSEMPSSQVIKP